MVVKYIKTIFLFFALFAVTLPLMARELDINVGSDLIRITYISPLEGADYGRKDITFGGFYNKDDNYFFDTSLLIIDEAGNKFPGLELGIGPKAYLGQTKTEEYLTFGIAGLINYRLSSINRLILSGSGYFSPSIISFMDANQMWEFEVRAAYEIIPSANIYVGYRKIEVDVNIPGERTVDDEFHFGFKMAF